MEAKRKEAVIIVIIIIKSRLQWLVVNRLALDLDGFESEAERWIGARRSEQAKSRRRGEKV